MPRRAGVKEPRVHGNKERQLTRIQRDMTAALLKAEELQWERDTVASYLYHERHYSQKLLAELLSEGAVAAGGKPLTEDAVQKLLMRRAS